MVSGNNNDDADRAAATSDRGSGLGVGWSGVVAAINAVFVADKMPQVLRPPSFLSAGVGNGGAGAGGDAGPTVSGLFASARPGARAALPPAGPFSICSRSTTA